MIDLFVYQVTESARNIVYERQRYLEGSSGFWDPERETALNDLLELFRSENFTPRLELSTDIKDPRSLEKLLNYLQEIIDNYNKTTLPNVISPSIRQAYEKHLAQLELENKKESASPKTPLGSSLKTILPSASPELIKEVSLLIENNVNQQGVEAGLEQAVHIISNISKITSTPLDDSLVALALAPLSSEIDALLGTKSPDLPHQYALVSSVLFGEVKTPSPQALSSVSLKIPQIQAFVKSLANPSIQLDSLYKNSKPDLHIASGLLASLVKATSKLDTPHPPEKLVLARSLFEISPLLNYVYSRPDVTQKISRPPLGQAQFQEFLVRMGLNFVGPKRFLASPTSVSAAISSSLDTIFAPSIQSYYTRRATRSPYFKQFLVAYEAASAIKTNRPDSFKAPSSSRIPASQGFRRLQEQIYYQLFKLQSFFKSKNTNEPDLTDPLLNLGALAGSIGLIMVSALVPSAPFLLVPIGGGIFIYNIYILLTKVFSFSITSRSPVQVFNGFLENVFAGVAAVLASLFLFIGIVVLSIPIIIALILFIINSSALVVPPNNLTASGSGIIGGGGTCTVPSSGFCSPSYLSPTFGTQTNNAAQICNRESIGGNPAALNDSCLNYCGEGGDLAMVTSTTNPSVSIRKCTWVNRNGTAYHTGDYSAGLFQTNLLCSSHFEPSSNGTPKECYKAFAVNYCGSLTCPNVSDWTLLANCVAYFWNPDNSIAYSNNQSSCNDTDPDTRNWGPWTTAKSCGIQSNCAP